MNPARIVCSGCAAFLCVFQAQTAIDNPSGGQCQNAEQKEAGHRKLPPALATVPLERLSSAALRLLDHNGDLVQWPGVTTSSASALASDPSIVAGLDPRVGVNLRLGNDP